MDAEPVELVKASHPDGSVEEERLKHPIPGVVNKRKKKSLAPGVVYLSRIPPFMQPRKVRHPFSPFGTVGRIYLQPEGG